MAIARFFFGLDVALLALAEELPGPEESVGQFLSYEIFKS